MTSITIGTEMEYPFKYFAFISCSSKDSTWGKRLQKKMESQRMPATLCHERGWKRTPMNPVFFAPTDIQPGSLSEELHKRLEASRYLIVICSPNSAKSDWVSMEIEYFYQLGRGSNIHFFIVDGTPHSNDPQTECFNPVIDRLGIPEILGANINEKYFKQPWLNRERAYVQLFSKLLEVDFDTIWQRHKRRTKRKVAAWSIGGLAILAAIIATMIASRPADVRLQVHEASVHNDNLPPMRNAVVTLSADNIQEIGAVPKHSAQVPEQTRPNHRGLRGFPSHRHDRRAESPSIGQPFQRPEKVWRHPVPSLGPGNGKSCPGGVGGNCRTNRHIGRRRMGHPLRALGETAENLPHNRLCHVARGQPLHALRQRLLYVYQ